MIDLNELKKCNEIKHNKKFCIERKNEILEASKNYTKEIVKIYEQWKAKNK